LKKNVGWGREGEGRGGERRGGGRGNIINHILGNHAKIIYAELRTRSFYEECQHMVEIP